MKAYEAQPSKGGEGDIVRIWRKIYQEKGWHKFAAFDGKGGFNAPYMLFKAKNITDPTVRVDKWAKGRPIAPGTKHPMRKLLHLAGRAWSFLCANLPGEHFAIQHGGQVPTLLRKAEALTATWRDRVHHQGYYGLLSKHAEAGDQYRVASYGRRIRASGELHRRGGTTTQRH